MENRRRDARNSQILNAHLYQYQALLLNNNRLTFDKSLAINPTTLILDNDPEYPIHDFLKMLDIILGAQHRLTDIPFTNKNVYLYTDGSGFAKKESICRGKGNYGPKGGHLHTNLGQEHIHLESRNNFSDTCCKIG